MFEFAERGQEIDDAAYGHEVEQPWTILGGNDGHLARAKVVETFAKRSEDELE